MTVDRQKKIQEALEKIEKEHGKGSVVMLGQKATQEYETIRSGSIGLDLVLGIGGYGKGRVIEMAGWEGSGKTTLAQHAVAECQAAGGTAAYIDGEHAVDTNYMRAMGIDTDALILSQPDNGEQGFNIAKTLIESDAVDLVILDSDSALIPESVINGEIGESAIGKKARLNSDAYPKLKKAATKHAVTVIVISQYREKIGVMFGNPTTTQGGHALKFYADVRMEVAKKVNAANKDGDVESNRVKVKVIKNKMAPPFKTCEFDILFGKGIDKEGELIDKATELEVIKKSGSWFAYGDSKIGQGRDAVKQFLADNPELMEEIKTKVYEALNIK